MTQPMQLVSWPDPTLDGPNREVRSLAEADGLKLVSITLRHGTELPNHVAPGPITIQVVSGRVALLAAEEVHELAPGQVALLPAGMYHTLRPMGDATVTVILNRCSSPGVTS